MYVFWGVGGYVCHLIFLYDLSHRLSNLCHCVQHPWKLTIRDFWSCRNMKKPLSQLKHVLRTCSGVSQKNMVYGKVDIFVKMICYKVMTIEHEHFPIYLLWNPIHVCWNTQNRAQFSETINLRGHMPKFTLNMHVFPSIFFETPYMCVETLRTGLNFLRQSIWGVTCLSLLSTCMSFHLSSWKPHKCVLQPWEEGSFFWDDQFEGSHA